MRKAALVLAVSFVPSAALASASALAPAAAKRPRGGQHAARHGKPSRRSRGPARPAPARDTDDHQAPALETLDPIPANDQDPWVTPGPMTASSHAPWETGDRP